MLIKTANQQRTADALKAVVLKEKQDKGQRDSALAIISRFEAADWQPILFERAMEAVQTPLKFNEDGTLAGDAPADATADITALLAMYLVLVANEEQLLTTDEAADYAGVARWTIDHHYRRSGKLKGIERGGRLYFRKADVDEFLRTERKSGNPHKIRA